MSTINELRLDGATSIPVGEAGTSLQTAVREYVSQRELTHVERAGLAVVVAELAGELALENAAIRLNVGQKDEERTTDAAIELQRVAGEVLSTLNERV